MIKCNAQQACRVDLKVVDTVSSVSSSSNWPHICQAWKATSPYLVLGLGIATDPDSANLRGL